MKKKNKKILASFNVKFINLRYYKGEKSCR